MGPEPKDDAILAELGTIARRGAPGSLRFGSLAAAHEYKRFANSGAAICRWGPKY